MPSIPLAGLALAASLLLLAAPARAADQADLDLSLHYGGDRYDAVGLRSGLGGVGREGRLRDASSHLGATIVYRSGLSELGIIGELGRVGQAGTTTLLGALAGVGLPVGPLRLEALGELAAHRYGDALADPSLVSRSAGDAWLVSVGLRPGLSLALWPSAGPFMGVWGFARWDVTSQDVQVDLGGGNRSTYRLGGSQFGASLRLGWRL